MATKILHILSALLILCSNASFSQFSHRNNSSQADIIYEYQRAYCSQFSGIPQTAIYNTDLYFAMESWLGAPYKYAGTTYNGVDCSGLVRNLCNNTYLMELSGNSVSMFRSSAPVKRKHLEEGDLVFFRIRRNKVVSHVGLYLGNDKFVHASRSSGVIISDLDDPYYKKHFVRGGRMEHTGQSE